jgi:ribosomal protein L11 methyltransferase
LTDDVRAFVVSIPSANREEVELASDQLWQLGVRAIEERTEVEGVELWTTVGDREDAIHRAVTSIADRWPWRVVDINVDPVDTWREFAKPVWATPDLVVVPAWQSHSFDGDPLVLRIEPGAAFGLGDHPTTELSLRALASLLRAVTEQPPAVLDVGCGTGILAVAAARLGAYPVRAVDVASSAVETTADNAARNGVAGQIVVDTRPAADLGGMYDIVVANILAPVLVRLADDLRRLTVRGGHLIISGILEDSHAHVLDALAPMSVVRREVLDGWIAVTLRH